MSLREDFTRIRQLFDTERGPYMVGAATLVGMNLADAMAPIFMGVAIDLTEANLQGQPAKTPVILERVGLEIGQFSLTGAILVYLGLMVFANALRYPMLMYTSVPSHRIGQRLRRRLTGKLLRLEQAYYDRSKSGDLMSLATADIDAVRMMFGPGVTIAFDTVAIFVFVFLVMFAMSWPLALTALIPLPLIAVITNKLSHMEYSRFGGVQEDIGLLTERTRESYAGIRIVQGYAREIFDRARFDRFSRRHYALNMRLAQVNSMFDPILSFMVGLGTLLIFGVGGVMVFKGSVGLGTFVAFIFLVRHLTWPMVGLGWAVSLFQRGRASLKRLDTLYQEEIGITSPPTPRPLHAAGGDLVIRNLSFSYSAPRLQEEEEEGQKEASALERAPVVALQNVSLRLPAGQTLGVIGAVGSGKSTLARLLVRLYDPAPGTITLGGEDIRNVSLEALRSEVVLAPQNTFLFGDTVGRNIMMTAKDPQADVTTYTTLASLHEEILELKDGYDTMLGERGINLSGGQRQRLAIARAIAADPTILILDDCLSAVDARTEETILSNLGHVFAGRTGIIISHRVRAVQRCDHIVVLEQGRLLEEGTHEELLAKKGVYASIASEQMKEPPILHKAGA